MRDFLFCFLSVVVFQSGVCHPGIRKPQRLKVPIKRLKVFIVISLMGSKPVNVDEEATSRAAVCAPRTNV